MEGSFKSAILKTNVLLGILISFIATFFLFPSNFEMALYPLQLSDLQWMSLDPSWVSGLNYINLKELVWGKDFAFTLGPLSYLSTRVGWGNNRLDFLLFDLFCALNFFLVFFITFTKSNHKIITVGLILTISVIMPVYIGSLYAFVLLSFLLFWIKYSLEIKSQLPYLFQTIILFLLFYIKFNTGLISFIVFFAAIFYKVIFMKERQLYLILYSFLPLILIFLTSITLNVNIPLYIKNALYIVAGYNEIMYLDIPFGYSHLSALILLIIPFFFLIVKIVNERKSANLQNFFNVFLFAISGYILFKQSFLRADQSHIKEFFLCILLITICTVNLNLKLNNYLKHSLLFLMIGISVFNIFRLDYKSIPIGDKISKLGYFQGFKNFTSISGFQLFPNQNQLPDKIKNTIGNNTIDSYPWNLQILLENKLNFTPRPVFQAYAAYTPELEELNFEYYNSIDAPKFVLYDYGSIDERYPQFDESKLNLLFSVNYKCRDTLTIGKRSTLLLEKTNSRKIKFVKSREYAMYIDSPIIPKDNVFYKIYVYPNLSGKFVSIINHSPTISLGVVTKDGNSKYYKTSKGLLETGIFGKNHISNSRDFKGYLQKNNIQQNEISAYYFKPKNANLFNEKIRVIEYKIETE